MVRIATVKRVNSKTRVNLLLFLCLLVRRLWNLARLVHRPPLWGVATRASPNLELMAMDFQHILARAAADWVP